MTIKQVEILSPRYDIRDIFFENMIIYIYKSHYSMREREYEEIVNTVWRGIADPIETIVRRFINDY